MFEDKSFKRKGNMESIQKTVNESFLEYFGRTPLKERLDDILKEAIGLHRFTDMDHLKEETGDLLASAMQLCNESGWESEELIKSTLEKIKKRKLQYKTLGRKRQIAILGGAFDPITIGHIKLAQFVLNSSKTFDYVWIMPCYQHMYNKKMTSPEIRLEMCNIAASTDRRISVSDYEIRNKFRGETYKLIKSLMSEEEYKDKYDFSLIMGLDNANTFDKWVNYEELERMTRFVVVPRKGVNRDLNVDWYLKSPHIYLSPDNDIPNISSTIIRDNLKIYWEHKFDNPIFDVVNDALKEDLPKGVLKYINENRLYV